MGMIQPFGFDASWNQAADLLDGTFPLASGSHRDAAAYLVHFDHLLVIREDGSCTGLARPGQFVEADGDDGAPRAIVLEHDGLQVEIEPATGRRCASKGTPMEHRLQLLTALAVAS